MEIKSKLNNPYVQIKGKKYPVVLKNHSFLANPDDWDKDWLEAVMKDEGIKKLTEEHMEIIHNLRKYHERNGNYSPEIHCLSEVVKCTLKRIYDLFGEIDILYKISGLQRKYRLS
jgi:TusE/DsrC/DsvC family sulfur relay protein